MKKKFKIGLSIFFGAIISIALFMGFGLYLLAIEDFHGGYEEVYHASKNGDFVVLIDKKRNY